MNKSDSERIAAALKKQGHKPIEADLSAKALAEADLIIVNMCSVRQSAVDRIYGLAPKLDKIKAKNNKVKTILTGCILKKDKEKFRKIFDVIQPRLFKTDGLNKKMNIISRFIPVSNGCNNFCTYCVVPYTRGSLVCQPHQKIIKEVKKSVKNNIREIWLLGQNVNRYRSKKINFAKLLRMINNVPGEFSIRFTSPHPADFTDELINTMAECKKVAKYLNLPVQSGDNSVLKKMNRSYTVEEYKELVKKIRRKIPDINLSTDVIVGFPGETKKQFENTAKLFREINFNLAYVAKYSARPGTAAFQLKDDVSLKEKKEREKILQDIVACRKRKLIALIGPTASGKSELAVRLALWLNSKKNKKEFGINGAEIISVDSRQVYKGMNIGTAKISKKEMKNVPHHLLSVINPKSRFTVVQYRKLALKAMNKTYEKNKIPILCGGTGFYVQALADGIVIPKVTPDWKLRRKLEKKPAKELYRILKNLDPQRAKNIEKENPRRLIRAIEIAKKIGRVPGFKKEPVPYLLLLIGIKKEKKELSYLIKKRLLKRLKKGMIAEVKKLKKSGLSWKRLEEFGLEYRYIARYLQAKINYAEMIENIQKESENLVKRQMVWFKKDQRICWIKKQHLKFQAERLIKDFLKNKKSEV